jgi:hypothetical protein
VEFQPDAKPSLLTMAGIEIELSSLLGGQKVDLRTAQDLSRYFREEVIRAAETQYEAPRCNSLYGTLVGGRRCRVACS